MESTPNIRRAYLLSDSSLSSGAFATRVSNSGIGRIESSASPPSEKSLISVRLRFEVFNFKALSLHLSRDVIWVLRMTQHIEKSFLYGKFDIWQKMELDDSSGPSAAVPGAVPGVILGKKSAHTVMEGACTGKGGALSDSVFEFTSQWKASEHDCS